MHSQIQYQSERIRVRLYFFSRLNEEEMFEQQWSEITQAFGKD